MKKPTTRVVKLDDPGTRAQYDFRGGVRGKHHTAMQSGYTITIHQADGTTIVKEIIPKRGAVVLDPDIQSYFPDSGSVNRTLRCLIPLLPRKHRVHTKKAAASA